MTVYERIEYLRKKEGISQGNLEKELEFSNGSISKWKTSMPKPERLQKIANHFGVTLDFLMGKTDMVVCPVCGFGDNPLSEQSRKEHEERHNKFLLAKEKYPFIMKYSDEEKLRNDSMGDFLNSGNCIEKQMIAYENYTKALFSAEARKRNYELEQLDYEQFFQSQIGKNETDETISLELADAIVEKHGLNRNFINNDDLLLARASNNKKLMQMLRYAENLSAEQLDSIIIQTKALADSNNRG